MTQPIVECVRECTRPCRCEQCLAAGYGEPLHPPIPVEADTGLLCSSCVRRLWVALHEIGDLYAELDWSAVETGPTEGGGGGKVTGSPAPFRLDVFALQDPSTRNEHDPEDRNAPQYVPNVVGKWAEVARRSLRFTSDPPADLNSALWVLVSWWQQVTEFVWIGRAHDELVAVHNMLKGAHQLNPPRRNRIGRCTARLVRHIAFDQDATTQELGECGAALYADAGPVTCRSCGRQYIGLDLIRMYAHQKETDQ